MMAKKDSYSQPKLSVRVLLTSTSFKLSVHSLPGP